MPRQRAAATARRAGELPASGDDAESAATPMDEADSAPAAAVPSTDPFPDLEDITL
jgi:hypothetical protein